LSEEGHINILVTGATGFVGVDLTRELVRQGYSVYAIVRDERKFRAVLGDECAGRVNVLLGDLLDRTSLGNLTKQLQNLANNFDVVVHTVGGGPLTSNRSLAPGIFDLNYKTTANLIEVMETSQKLGSLRLFVYFSSLAAMGVPDANGDLIHYNEASACNPVLPYERAKFETEAFLRDFANKRRVKTAVLRFPQIYGGPGDSLMQMVSMIRKGAFPVVRGKIGSLPLIHVRDAVGATCAMIAHIDAVQVNFAIYLVSEGSYTYDQLVDLVKKKFGQGGALKLPYSLLYLGISMAEVAFGLLRKPEPLNRRRLISLTKDRHVDSSKFVNTFQFKFQENVESFLANLPS